MATIEYKIKRKSMMDLNEKEEEIMGLVLKLNNLFDDYEYSTIFSALSTLLTEIANNDACLKEVVELFIRALTEGISIMPQMTECPRPPSKDSMN